MKVTDSERERALRIARDPMSAPITLDTLCLLGLALRDAEERWAESQSEVSRLNSRIVRRFRPVKE